MINSKKINNRIKEISRVLKRVQQCYKRSYGIDVNDKVISLSKNLYLCKKLNEKLINEYKYQLQNIISFYNQDNLLNFLLENKENIYGIIIDCDIDLYNEKLIKIIDEKIFPVIYISKDENKFNLV